MTKTEMTKNNSGKEGTKNPENGDSAVCEEQRQKSRRGAHKHRNISRIYHAQCFARGCS